MQEKLTSFHHASLPDPGHASSRYFRDQFIDVVFDTNAERFQRLFLLVTKWDKLTALQIKVWMPVRNLRE